MRDERVEGRSKGFAGLVWFVGASALILGLAWRPARAQQPGLQERLALCSGCHGANGISVLPVTPSLAGHPVLYTQTQLVLFREGQRVHEPMNAVTQGMSDDLVTAFAEHYAKLAPAPASGGPNATIDAKLDARGRELAATHRCGTCHLPDYAGRDQMARLAGQREDYLLKALQDYKKGARSGEGAQMAEVVYGLSDDDLKAVAHHIAHVK
jgi:cytochrome c553